MAAILDRPDDDAPRVPSPLDDLASAQSRRAQLEQLELSWVRETSAEPSQPWPVSIISAAN